jgi:hypothetical protein
MLLMIITARTMGIEKNRMAGDNTPMMITSQIGSSPNRIAPITREVIQPCICPPFRHRKAPALFSTGA